MIEAYFLFLAKIMTFVLATLLLLAGIFSIAGKQKKEKAQLEIKKLNSFYTNLEKTLREVICDKHEFKNHLKQLKKAEKQIKKISKKRMFVLNFYGDVKASAVKNLREEITALLTIATPEDEIVLKLESHGGMVHAYGLAASELERIRRHQIPLTIIVDKIAASGGYMMAVVANKILAAPFAVIGSIGVIAQLPNFNQWLQKHHIDFEQITAGQYKRTLSLFGKNTQEGRYKFQTEVNETHELFKTFVRKNRPVLNVEQIATGEHWFGAQAIELRLVDELMTSDDYLLNASKNADIYSVNYNVKPSLMDKIFFNAHRGFKNFIQGLIREKPEKSVL